MFTSPQVSGSKVSFTVDLKLMNMQNGVKSFRNKCPFKCSANLKANEG